MKINEFNKNINKIILFCISIVPIVFFPFGKYRDYFYEPKANILTILAVLVLILFYLYRENLNNVIQVDSINISLFVYFIFISISLFFAQNLYLALQGRPYRVDGYSTILVYILLFIAARNSKLSNLNISKAVLITASVLSIYGIIQYFGVDPFPRDFIRENWTRSFATLGNPNFMGAYLVLVLPFSFHLFIDKKRNLGLFAFVLLFFCLLCTQTRGSWIGYIFSFLIYSVFLFYYGKKSKSKIKRYLIILIITIILITFFNFLTDGYFEKRFLSIAEEASELVSNGEKAERGGGSRVYIWKKVLQLISEKPFWGYGIENLMETFVDKFGSEMNDKFGRILYVDKAHNEYLHIAVTTGMPSLIAYIVFIILLLKNVFINNAKSSYYWPISSAVVGYLVQSFFNISVVSVAYIFWIFLGFSSDYSENLLNND